MADFILKPLTKPEDTAPALDLEFVKRALEIDDSRLDEQISVWIEGSTQHAQRLRGEVLMTQDWEMILPAGFPSGNVIRLQPRPVQSINYVKYRDSSNVVQTFGTLSGSPVTTEEYELIDHPTKPLLMLRGGYTWPTPAKDVRIGITCGYTEIPALVKTGMILLVGNWHENREAVISGAYNVNELPLGVKALLARPKVG
jgi:hypothetical protein